MILVILMKVIICAIIIGWSIAGQCMHRLRDSFHTTWDCTVFEYVHECSIPSNGLNMVIFDMVNVVLGKAMKSSPLLGPFGGSEFLGFSLLKI